MITFPYSLSDGKVVNYAKRLALPSSSSSSVPPSFAFLNSDREGDSGRDSMFPHLSFLFVFDNVLEHVFEVQDAIVLNKSSIEGALGGKIKLAYCDFSHFDPCDASFATISRDHLTYLTDSLVDGMLMINCGFSQAILLVCFVYLSFLLFVLTV